MFSVTLFFVIVLKEDQERIQTSLKKKEEEIQEVLQRERERAERRLMDKKR